MDHTDLAAILCNRRTEQRRPAAICDRPTDHRRSAAILCDRRTDHRLCDRRTDNRNPTAIMCYRRTEMAGNWVPVITHILFSIVPLPSSFVYAPHIPLYSCMLICIQRHGAVFFLFHVVTQLSRGIFFFVSKDIALTFTARSLLFHAAASLISPPLSIVSKSGYP